MSLDVNKSFEELRFNTDKEEVEEDTVFLTDLLEHLRFDNETNNTIITIYAICFRCGAYYENKWCFRRTPNFQTPDALEMVRKDAPCCPRCRMEIDHETGTVYSTLYYHLEETIGFHCEFTHEEIIFGLLESCPLFKQLKKELNPPVVFNLEDIFE
jgi:hypothetical protein